MVVATMCFINKAALFSLQLHKLLIIFVCLLHLEMCSLVPKSAKMTKCGIGDRVFICP